MIKFYFQEMFEGGVVIFSFFTNLIVRVNLGYTPNLNFLGPIRLLFRVGLLHCYVVVLQQLALGVAINTYIFNTIHQFLTRNTDDVIVDKIILDKTILVKIIFDKMILDLTIADETILDKTRHKKTLQHEKHVSRTNIDV